MLATARQWILLLITLIAAAGAVYLVMQDQASQLTERLSSLESELSGVKEELSIAASTLEAERTGASNQVSALEIQLDETSDQRTELQAQFTEARDQIAALEAQLAETREQLSTLEAERTGTSDQVSALESQLNETSDQRTDFQAQSTEARDQITTLEAQLALQKESAEAATAGMAREQTARIAAEVAAHENAEASAVGNTLKMCRSELAALVEAEPILFQYNSTAIPEASNAELEKVASIVAQCPTARIEVRGHSDANGHESNNLLLSHQRAQAVVADLLNSGVEVSELYAVGYGSSQPLASNDTADGRSQNRRIEFAVR